MKLEFLKIAGLLVSYTGLILALLRINRTSVKRYVKQEEVIKQIVKEVDEMKAEHEKEIDKIEGSIRTMENTNRDSHGRLFEKMSELGEGIAKINGYLAAKKEVLKS